MERVAGRMAGESTKRFEAMGGVVSLIGRSIASLHRLRELETYGLTKVSLSRRSFGMAIGIRFCARQQLERRMSDSELDGACHAIEFSVDLTTPLSHDRSKERSTFES